MNAYDVQPLNNNHRAIPPKVFFAKELFKRVIFPETQFYNHNNPNHRIQSWGNLFTIILTVLCVFFILNSYKYNQVIITEAQELISKHIATKAQSEEPLLAELNILQSTLKTLSASPQHWYNRVGIHESRKLYKKTEQLYLKLLTSQFVPYLKTSIESQLDNVKEENCNQLYSSLKIYLMLGHPDHFDNKYFMSWFENYWHQNIKNENQDALSKHLAALLSQPMKAIPLDSRVIENTRALLNNMPQSRLVLTILQNQYQRSSVKILPNEAANLFSNIPREISGIYDIKNFRNVYYSEIEKTCQEITNGNWVLDRKAQPSFSDIALNQLTSEVKAIYINEYAVTWSNILAKIKMDEFSNISQIISAINLLNNPQSPLIQLINTIKNNTQPISDSVEFTQQVSTRFLALNALSNDVLKNTNQSILLAVREYLNRIALSPDSLKISYDAAKNRMENQNGGDAIAALLQQARMLPEPLRTWHTTIAAESWRIILQNTQAYLNRIWIATVYPQYAAVLNNRYPLFKDSTIDIAMSDFANFFGNNGVVDTFFKTYLQPFVDSSRLYWEWKNVDGQRINIPQPTLEMFIRAALIQKMFFPDENRQPAIAFSIVPVELGAGVQSFTLDLEGQLAAFQKDNEQIISLSWPGPGPSHTELTFTDDLGKKIVMTETGPWSWFRILDKSKLEATTNPKHFRLTFGSNSTTASYELYASGIVNPFLQGILNAFRCPEAL
jgi:type VI protein secretion system component VasK